MKEFLSWTDELTKKPAVYQLNSNQQLYIREATRSDAAQTLDFIQQLALFEKAPHECQADLEGIEAMFDRHLARVRFAYLIDGAVDEGQAPEDLPLMSDGDKPLAKPVGFSLFFEKYTTWQCAPSMHLEELFVDELHRGQGIGKLILKDVAKVTAELGYSRLEWVCLDWNTKAQAFYEEQGARAMSEWITYRLEGESLDKFK